MAPSDETGQRSARGLFETNDLLSFGGAATVIYIITAFVGNQFINWFAWEEA